MAVYTYGGKEIAMKSIYIKLTTVDDVYTLVKSLLAFDGDVDLVSGRYIVDGRSLLGIFSLDLTKPVAPGTMKLTTPAPQPKVTPAPVKKAEPALEPIVSTASSTPKPAAAASTATDLSQITNTGPIPVAMRVPGDPTRVYNPLNPNKTIRVVDKDGKPFPSGKKLKVRGTNFMFYVP